MSACEEIKTSTLSELEHAVNVGSVQNAEHAFNTSNQGVGDILRLEMLIPKLESLKGVPEKDAHIDEIDALIKGVENRIEYLRGKG